MKKIEVLKWEEQVVDPKTQKPKKQEANTIKMISVLMSNRDPDKLPKGIDNFRLMSRVSKALDKAEKNGKIEFESGDYSIIKKAFEEDVPPVWGLNPDVTRAVEGILDAKDKEAS